MRYTGLVEVPLQRAGALVGVRLTDVSVESLPFLLVLVDVRVKAGAPPAPLYEASTILRSAMDRMGFDEYTDYTLVHVAGSVDVTEVEAAVLSQSSSGPATNRFRKTILEATDYRLPKAHGVVFVGLVSEWPTGLDHGSYQFAGSDTLFRSFCTSMGFLTCSVKEDCLGHEVGHAFGLEHRRHNWYGFAPTQDHRDAMRHLTRCAAEPDRGWPDGEWDMSLLDDLGN